MPIFAIHRKTQVFLTTHTGLFPPSIITLARRHRRKPAIEFAPLQWTPSTLYPSLQYLMVRFPFVYNDKGPLARSLHLSAAFWTDGVVLNVVFFIKRNREACCRIFSKNELSELIEEEKVLPLLKMKPLFLFLQESHVIWLNPNEWVFFFIESATIVS